MLRIVLSAIARTAICAVSLSEANAQSRQPTNVEKLPIELNALSATDPTRDGTL